MLISRVGLAMSAFMAVVLSASSLFADERSSPFASFSAASSASAWSADASVYTGKLDTNTTDPLTSFETTMTGVMGSLAYRTPFGSLALVGITGRAHVMYLQILQDTYTTSNGLGLRGSADIGPVTFTVGGSMTRDTFGSVLQNSVDSWDGSGREVHVKAAGQFHFGGPVWVAPELGYRHLELQQDAHMLGSRMIPDETKSSNLFVVGARLELQLVDQRHNEIRPWVFGGLSHEFENQPPMGPSFFLTDGFAGNQFTAFPAGTSGAPPVFPAHDTQVVGVGLDLDIQKVFSVRGAWYRTFNESFDGVSYKLGAVIHW